MKNNPAIVSDQNFQVTPTKDTGYSSFGNHDYVVNGEITVAITLAEYRELVGAQAKAAQLESYSRRLEAENKLADANRALEEANKRICSLEAMIAKTAMKKEGSTNE